MSSIAACLPSTPPSPPLWAKISTHNDYLSRSDFVLIPPLLSLSFRWILITSPLRLRRLPAGKVLNLNNTQFGFPATTMVVRVCMRLTTYLGWCSWVRTCVSVFPREKRDDDGASTSGWYSRWKESTLTREHCENALESDTKDSHSQTVRDSKKNCRWPPSTRPGDNWRHAVRLAELSPIGNANAARRPIATRVRACVRTPTRSIRK